MAETAPRRRRRTRRRERSPHRRPGRSRGDPVSARRPPGGRVHGAVLHRPRVPAGLRPRRLGARPPAHPRHRRQLRLLATRRRAVGGAPHGHRPGPPRTRPLGEAESGLLGGGLRQRDARPPERAGGRPGHRRRAFAGRRRGGAVRLPVSRSLRAAGPGGQRGSGPDGQPPAPRGRRPRNRIAHAAVRPASDPVRQPPGRRAAARLRHRARARRRGDPGRLRRACPTRRPAWPSCGPSVRASTGTVR